MASSFGIRAGRAFVELSLQSRIEAGLRKAEQRLNSFARSTRDIGGKLFGAGLAAATPFAFAIKSASDLQETMNKFDVVFADQKDAVKAWGDGFAGEVGRSKNQIAGFLAGTQDLLVPLGFEAGAATQMSKDLTGLALDLASFNNMSDDAVLRDLHAALTGSGEVMKKYGVIVSEAAVNQQLLNDGVDPKTATDQQKVMARYSLILAGTTAAQGDAIRSSGAYANQMKRLQGVLDDVAAAIGNAILPAVTEAVTAFADGLGDVEKWAGENQELIRTVAAVAAGLVGAGAALIGFSLAASAASFAVGGLTTAVGLLFGGAQLLAGGALFTALIGGFDETAEAGVDAFGRLRDTGTRAWQSIADKVAAGDLEGAIEVGLAAVELMWQETIGSFRETWAPFLDALDVGWTESAALGRDVWSALVEFFTSTTASMADSWAAFGEFVGLNDGTEKVGQSWHDLVNDLAEMFIVLGAAWEELVARMSGPVDKVVDTIQDAADFLGIGSGRKAISRDLSSVEPSQATTLDDQIQAIRQRRDDTIQASRDIRDEKNRQSESRLALSTATAEQARQAASDRFDAATGTDTGQASVDDSALAAELDALLAAQADEDSLIAELDALLAAQDTAQAAQQATFLAERESATTAGTFSTRAAGQLGGGATVLERVATAAEKTNDLLGQIAANTDDEGIELG